MSTNPPLNEVQLMLLKLFSRPMSEQEVEAMRFLLLNHYEAMLDKEVEKVIAEKGITNQDIDKMLVS